MHWILLPFDDLHFGWLLAENAYLRNSIGEPFSVANRAMDHFAVTRDRGFVIYDGSILTMTAHHFRKILVIEFGGFVLGILHSIILLSIRSKCAILNNAIIAYYLHFFNA